jgi:hypothetical protein
MISILMTVLGLIAIGIFSVQVYKTALSTERSAGGWAVLTAGLGIFFQFVLPFFLTVALLIFYMVTENDPVRYFEESSGLVWIINVGSLILSVVAMATVSKHVSKVIDIPVGTGPAPPPPPTFG